MSEFLELIPPGRALSILLDHLPTVPPDLIYVDTITALDGVTAASIISPEPLPAFARSTVDGYAVHAANTFSASDTLPCYIKLVGEIPMGRVPEIVLQNGQAALIHTGGMLPEGCDAVVMIENTQQIGVNEVEINKSVAPGDNIINAGEDVLPGQEVIPAGKRLGPADIGGLLALGVLELPIARPPKVGILSSGDEVIAPDKKPGSGQVRDINSYALSALVKKSGGQPICYGIIPDLLVALQSAVEKAIQECDMVVITAGSSASVRDLTAEVIQKLGTPGVLVHGVNIKPGKPTILAVCNGKPVIGLPGNPVSALVIAGLFVVPMISRLLGITSFHPRPSYQARLTINIPSQAGREDWVPVSIHPSETGLLAEPIFFKSNLIFTLAKADGLIKIPLDANGLTSGEIVEVISLF